MMRFRVTGLAACTVLLFSLPAFAQQTSLPGAPLAVVPERPSGPPTLVTLTFSEYPLGTVITNQYQNSGIIFSGSPGLPFISVDGSNPTAPVLSGSPQFLGSITANFVDPNHTNKPAQAGNVAFDAGYFDSVGSTTVTWFDAAGNVLGSMLNTTTGIQRFSIPGAIAGFTIGITSSEPAGFAIDNLSFQIIAKGPEFAVQYSSYIPVDHVSGPTLCTYALPYPPLIYKGDANRGTYRTAESLIVVPTEQEAYDFFPDTGQTRNYDAYHSPVNGSTLSSLDDDPVPRDCYLWNDAAKADPSGFSHDESYPFKGQAQVHYVGSASNPLEALASWGPITWDMRTVIDVKNNNSATAYVNYNHTCYPSHQIKVNGQVVYLYTPPENDLVYITECLTGLRSHISGQTGPMAVPVQ